MNAEESQEIAEEGTRLFVGGLSSEVDDSKLREAFQQFGRLRDGKKHIEMHVFLLINSNGSVQFFPLTLLSV